MLSEDSKRAIDSLSFEELLEELVKGKSSRFQEEKREYLVTRYLLLQKRQNDEYKKRELDIAIEANDIAQAANETSSKAYRISVFSVLIALLALSVAVFKQCASAP